MRCEELTKESGKERFEEAARVLQRSFENDPLQRWMFQRDYDYFDKLFFDCACVYLGYETGKAKVQVAIDDDDSITAVTVWFEKTPEWYEFWTLTCLTWKYPSAYYRFWYFGHAVDPVYGKLMGDEEHWFLFLIGSDPDKQGKGHASAVFKYQLDKVDKQGKRIYLECTHENTIPWYEKFGFEFKETVQQSDMPPMHLMVRPITQN